jgi:hypothetical protein
MDWHFLMCPPCDRVHALFRMLRHKLIIQCTQQGKGDSESASSTGVEHAWSLVTVPQGLLSSLPRGNTKNGNYVWSSGELKKELGRAQREVRRFTAALAALGNSNSNRRSTLSAAARKKISLAQKARWAKARGQAPKPKRTMSAAGRKRIAAAQRARWAKVRTGQKKAG